ncbi:MAG: 1-phosphofructokinase family hexose kinase [Candidatus Margulisiibacteriota bacterium]
MITTLTLNPTLDTTLYVNDFKPDDSNRVVGVQKDPGGKGLNVSRIAHKLGSKVSTITFFGGHTGDEVDDLLREEGLFPFTIRVSEDTRNNVTITKTDTYSQTRFNQVGPNVTEGEYQSLLSMVEQLGDNADVFVVSGSLPPGVKPDAYREIIRLLKKVKPDLKIILDSDTAPLKIGLEAGPYMIKPNIHEAERLLGREIKTEAEQVQALKDMRALGAETVVMSRGQDGLIGFDGKEFVEVKPLTVNVKSTVGAGDALVAGICYALEEGKSFSEMLEFGVLVSAAKVTTPGTGACGWEEINALGKRPQAVTLDY